MKNLKDIFKFLIKRQRSPDLRKDEHDQLLRKLHKERKSYGDDEFPEYIQKSLKQYDLTTPFFPEEELENLLSAFEKYNRSNNFSFHAEQISIHIEKILNENWDIIYKNIISFSDDELSDDNLQVFKYYEYLKELRLALLGIHHINSSEWCYKAIKVIDSIKINPYYKQLSFPIFSQPLEEIQQKIKVKANELDRNTLIMMSAGLMLVDFFRADSTNDYIKDILCISIASLATHYSARPIMKISKNLYQFFTNFSHIRNDKSEQKSRISSEKPESKDFNTIEIDFGNKVPGNILILSHPDPIPNSRRQTQLAAIQQELESSSIVESQRMRAQ